MWPSFELLLGAMLVGALTCYVLFGGADFGAGIWTLFARGRTKPAQRALIDEAIGPIWEANHVWLIIAVTILFTAFPRAFALISIRLHIPLTLLLIGIVLRGTAFAVRTHDVTAAQEACSAAPGIWRVLFAGSSLVTPALLGIVLGTIASGRLAGPTTSFMETFLAPWLAPFPLVVGLLTTALVAYLAAAYLLVESRDPDLRALFRRRARRSWLLTGILAALALWLARTGAPEIFHGLIETAWGRSTVTSAAAINLAAWWCLHSGRDRLAGLSAMGGAVAVIWGWALSQFPYLVEPSLTIYDAAPPATLRLLFLSLIGGSVGLLPLLFYLYRLFKGDRIGARDSLSA